MLLEQTLHPIEARCLKQLEHIKSENLYRTRVLNQTRKGAIVQYQQNAYLSFNSNDYLGHAQHPQIIESFKKSIEKYGIGSTGSPLLGGYHIAHKALEEGLSEFLNMPRVLLFSTGYSANLSTITSFVQSQDYLFQDKLNHASLIDAARYSQAKFQRYKHLNLKELELSLKKCDDQNTSSIKWIATDGVFSVDGDIAPLDQLASLVKQYHAGFIVDDAHGIGILGESGRGTMNHFNLNSNDVTLLTGSFGIAFGTFGAFVAGSDLLIENLLQLARGYIYTTALPPCLADATLASLQLLKTSDAQRYYLKQIIHYFKKCAAQLDLMVLPSMTPIQPVLIGDNLTTQLLANKLKEKKILVGAIRPPTVPKNTARIRIALTVHHTKSDIDYLLNTLVTEINLIRTSHEAL